MARHEPPLESDPHSMGVMAAAMNKMRESGSKVSAPKSVKAVSKNLVTVVRPVATHTAQRPKQTEEPWVDVPEHPKGAYDAFLRPKESRRLAVQQDTTYTNSSPPSEVVTYQEKESVMENGWKKSNALKLLGVLALFAALIAVDLERDWSAERRALKNEKEAASNLVVARMKAEIAALQVVTPKKQEVQSTPLLPAVAKYDCTTAQSSENGYNSGVIHQLSDTVAPSVTFNGCVRFMVDESVASVTGEGFLIEFPETPGSNNMFKSPTAQNPDAGVFWNKIATNPRYSGQVIQIILTPNGHVTITKKGG
jgi:hypothetical protein